MKMKSSLVNVVLLLCLLSFAVSCEHEPFPTCEGVALEVDAIKTDADPGQSNGTLIATANGPAKYFIYSLNNSEFQASDKFTGLDSGVYTVTVKNSWGCIGSKEIKINQIDPCAGVAFTTSTTNATLGKTNGSVTGLLTGGTGYSFRLNNGQFKATNTFSGLAAGNYTITAKDSLGCIFTAQAIVAETDPCSGVTVIVTATTTNPLINQSNGKIIVSATGGTGFTYKLNNGAFQSVGVFSGLAAGSYTVTAKSADGCTATTQATLTTINPCAGINIVVTTTLVNPILTQSNGSITAVATGGSSAFTYSLNGGPYQASGTFNNLASGNYTVTAKNVDGCTGLAQVALGSSNPCAGVTVAVTAAVTDATAGSNNGSITATATGGTGFTYSLNNGAYQAGKTFSGLAAGNYTITAKNSNGCLGSSQFTVASINLCAGVTVAVTGTVTNASVGQSNGVIAASATGGTGFTYSLNGGAYQASGTFSGLASGSYSISAKNSNGCLGSTTFTITSSNPCTSTTITIATTVTASNNCVTPGTGSIVAIASGSTGFTYNLNNGAYQASATFSALSPGNYTIGAKDSNGCTSSVSVTVGTVAAGQLFTAVRVLMQTRCSGSSCHTNGKTQKGYNFDTDCKIVSAWSGIEGSCITNKLAKMPISPQSNLTTAEKKVITDWIAAGHAFTN